MVDDNQRIKYYDTAKGILILLVVIGHILNRANPEYDIKLYSVIQGFILSFHMPAFFIISGLLIKNEKWKDLSFSKFLLNKFKTLIIPYLFFEVIGAIYQTVVLGTQNFFWGIYNLLTVNCNVGANWFLPAMFVSSLLYFLYTKIENKWIGGIFATAFLFSSWVIPNGGLWETLARGLMGFSFIYLGNITKSFFDKQTTVTTVISIFTTGVLAAASFLWFCNDFYTLKVQNPILFALSGLSGCYMIIGISKKIHCKGLNYIGNNTIVILGTHQLVLYTVGASSSILWVIGIFSGIVLLELGLIWVLNKFVPGLIGKGRRA